MKWFGILLFCLLGLGLSSCKKSAETVEKEIEEAGFSMTPEGWFKTIRANNVAVMKKMVSGDFDFKAVDEMERNGLHIAAETGAIEAAEYLLNRGLLIDQKDSKGRTPLMAAVSADQPKMVSWLIRQGADPQIKDQDGFMALMLAVNDQKSAVVEKLAPYQREDLDSALLLAAMVGDAKSIDVLTNYGASVYARMEDGRTALMVAAQYGHEEAVAMLMDLGASRFATTDSGESAQSFAAAAGHEEIAEMIEKGFGRGVLALDSEEQIALSMEEFLLPASPEVVANHDSDLVAENDEVRKFSESDNGEVTEHSESAEVSSTRGKVKTLGGAKLSFVSKKQTQASPSSGLSTDELPLIMRQYRQRELPVEVKKVSGNEASIHLAGERTREVKVRQGDTIPGSKLVIIKVMTRFETGKLNNSRPIEVGIVEVEDRSNGERREWITGQPALGHDPVALVEDAATGKYYLAKAGQKFSSEDGREFVVSDVRPSQLVIEDLSSGEVSTLRLRGSEG